MSDDLRRILARLDALERQLAFYRLMSQTGASLDRRVFYNYDQTRDGANWRWTYSLWRPKLSTHGFGVPSGIAGSAIDGYNAFELENDDNNAGIQSGIDLSNTACYAGIAPVTVKFLDCFLVPSADGSDPTWLFCVPNDPVDPS